MNHNGRRHNAEDAEAMREYREECDEAAQVPDETQSETSAYREAALFYLDRINSFARFVLEEGNSRLAAWQASYALGLPVCEDVSMHERALRLGLKRATISKGAKAFQRANNLPPSHYMKDADSTKAYHKARKDQLPEHDSDN